MRKRFKMLWGLVVIVVVGLMIPQNLQQPVAGASTSDYHPESFWYYPWGRSGTHKGVDIFAKKGTAIHPSTAGIVLYAGYQSMGGNTAIVLGPKWRLHYYAHMEKTKVTLFERVNKNDIIGTVGDSGNAKGKPPHLHYSIMTLIP
jgi:murein DD-endopeptidase MepM/ murein hydrolase activator NlpD